MSIVIFALLCLCAAFVMENGVVPARELSAFDLVSTASATPALSFESPASGSRAGGDDPGGSALPNEGRPRSAAPATLSGDWRSDPTWDGSGHPGPHWMDFTDLPELGRIVYCESRLNPNAKNPRSSASGLGQLLDIHAPKFTVHGWSYWADRYDPVRNRAITEELYGRQGKTPWLSSNECWNE